MTLGHTPNTYMACGVGVRRIAAVQQCSAVGIPPGPLGGPYACASVPASGGDQYTPAPCGVRC